MTTKEKFEFTGIDYDKLVNDISTLLSRYHWKNSRYGIEQMLDKFIENKRDLIEKMVKSPNYNNNLQIVTEEDFDVTINKDCVYNELSYFLDRIQAKEKIYSTLDDNGKSYDDCFVENLVNVPSVIDINSLDKMKAINYPSGFNKNKISLSSISKYNKLVTITDSFKRYYSATLDESMVEYLNGKLPKTEVNGKVTSHGIKAGIGMKTSRAFNKVYEMFGFGKDPLYLKRFPVYADLVKEGKIKRTVVISANPIDYLTMSFGNTWASCHTIDKRNTRNMNNSYSGAYCGGTLSYMLDGVSMVVYCPTNEKGEEKTHPEREWKIYRNMIHFKDGILIQSRVYPQANDGALDLYKKFRLIEQQEISKMLGIEHITDSNGNDTWIKKGASCSYGDMYNSYGVHYRDYSYSEFGGNISYIRNSNLYSCMNIGTDGICPNCGQSINRESYIVHDYCAAPTEQN